VTLSGLEIGSLTLDPAFDSAVVEYTATTENDADAVTATATDENAEVEITLGDAVIENGGDATWAEGENTLTVTVTNETATKTYTVTVTKS
jgi:hypothetical protein